MFSFIALLLYAIGLSVSEIKKYTRKKKAEKQLINDASWSGCYFF